MSQPAGYKTKVTSYTERNRLRSALKAVRVFQWKNMPEQYCEYRLDGTTADGQWLRVKQYNNGTFWVQSSNEDLLAYTLGAIGLEGRSEKPLGLSSSASNDSESNVSQNIKGRSPKLCFPYVGTDESGKGDYFGPLVVAGVLVNKETGTALKALGAKDSKTITDAQARLMLPDIVDIVGESGFALQVWMPEVYNENIAELKRHKKTLNDLMAAGHAKVINELHQANEGTEWAVVDQFTAKPLVKQILRSRGCEIHVHQLPKAEDQFIGVAAASIVARAVFLQKMDELSEKVGITLPKGAGAKVNGVAKRLWLQQSEEVLKSVVKWHFKSTDTVRGML